MITRTPSDCVFRRAVAGTVMVCLLGTALPPLGPRRANAQTNMCVQAEAAPGETPAAEHFLRDAVLAASFAGEPPDTTADDFVLPEEKDKKQLAKEIAVWTIAVTFVAFFIIKVFIEKDDEPADDGGNGKDVPPPQ